MRRGASARSPIVEAAADVVAFPTAAHFPVLALNSRASSDRQLEDNPTESSRESVVDSAGKARGGPAPRRVPPHAPYVHSASTADRSPNCFIAVSRKVACCPASRDEPFDVFSSSSGGRGSRAAPWRVGPKRRATLSKRDSATAPLLTSGRAADVESDAVVLALIATPDAETADDDLGPPTITRSLIVARLSEA